jgi:hypothetical protein
LDFVITGLAPVVCVVAGANPPDRTSRMAGTSPAITAPPGNRDGTAA